MKVEKFKAWKAAGRPRGNDPLYISHRLAKKNFRRELRRLSKLYEQQQLNDVVNSIGLDKSFFWRAIKKTRTTPGHKALAIRNPRKTVVHKLDDVLEAWREYFANLCTPKDDKDFDKGHFGHVTRCVSNYNHDDDIGDLLESPFTDDEVERVIDKLHLRKACGFDGVSNEQIKFAGPMLVTCLAKVFNTMCDIEYVPNNLRRGVQVPLFKGENLCSLDQSNYRGITLLSGFNKIFEMVLWERMKGWWSENEMISKFQGACRNAPVN